MKAITDKPLVMCGSMCQVYESIYLDFGDDLLVRGLLDVVAVDLHDAVVDLESGSGGG